MARQEKVGVGESKRKRVILEETKDSRFGGNRDMDDQSEIGSIEGVGRLDLEEVRRAIQE